MITVEEVQDDARGQLACWMTGYSDADPNGVQGRISLVSASPDGDVYEFETPPRSGAVQWFRVTVVVEELPRLEGDTQ